MRLVIEKPFGHDLCQRAPAQPASPGRLRRGAGLPHRPLPGQRDGAEHHGLPLRQPALGAVWSEQHIDHVQITVAEQRRRRGPRRLLRPGRRAARHGPEPLMQLLTMVAMEPPVAFEAESVRDEKLKVLQLAAARFARRLHDAGRARPVRQRLDRGPAGAGLPRGARRRARLAATETFVALKLYLDNWRWAGTPFYLRTGKRLPKRASEIVVQFKRVPHLPFSGTAAAGLDRTCWCCASSPTTALPCSSARRCRDRRCSSAR